MTSFQVDRVFAQDDHSVSGPVVFFIFCDGSLDHSRFYMVKIVFGFLDDILACFICLEASVNHLAFLKQLHEVSQADCILGSRCRVLSPIERLLSWFTVHIGGGVVKKVIKLIL